jgi:intein-encoded DNA endonuclease-like protein
MLSHFDLHILKISLNTSQSVALEKVKHVRSIIEKSIDDEHKFKNLEPEELNDFHKILQTCEFVLEKYENKKALRQNLKKFVNTIESTLMNLESLDDEINELVISANFSINKMKEFESNLFESKMDSHQHHTSNWLF